MFAFTIQVAGAEWRLNWLQAPATLRSGKVLLRTEPLKFIFIPRLEAYLPGPTPYRKPEVRTYQ